MRFWHFIPNFIWDIFDIIIIIIVIVPIFKKGNRTIVGNYRPVSIINNLSKIFESIIQDHHSFYLKFKLHPNQH
jgi:hypothetical protein